jgi:hypothetical protein
VPLPSMERVREHSQGVEEMSEVMQRVNAIVIKWPSFAIKESDPRKLDEEAQLKKGLAVRGQGRRFVRVSEQTSKERICREDRDHPADDG